VMGLPSFVLNGPFRPQVELNQTAFDSHLNVFQCSHLGMVLKEHASFVLLVVSDLLELVTRDKRLIVQVLRGLTHKVAASNRCFTGRKQLKETYCHQEECHLP